MTDRTLGTGARGDINHPELTQLQVDQAAAKAEADAPTPTVVDDKKD